MSSSDRQQQWQPGDPLTEDDRTLLAPLIARARELGRTPVRREVANAFSVKRRFRTWGNACRAAGLVWVNYPERRRLAEAHRCGAQAASDQTHRSESNHRGRSAAGQELDHAEGATRHGGRSDHETPAD